MIVTRMEEWSKSRTKIYIDHEFAFVLYKGELRLYQVREGAELSEETYRIIMAEVLPKRAKLRAMNLLKSREYTTQQLRQKLQQGFYPERVIDEALSYVGAFHYTDDLRYAVDYINCCAESRSRMRIEQDLQAKGIGRELLQKAWTVWEEQGGEMDEERQIRVWLEKRHFHPDTADYRESSKQAAFLMRKGFSAEKIRKVLRDFEREE